MSDSLDSSKDLQRTVIVTRVARAKEIRAKYASSSLARFVMNEEGESYDNYEDEEENLRKVVDTVSQLCGELGPVLTIERGLLPGTPLLHNDRIICIGQDGLVANTLRYAKDIPIYGVNPDPKRYEGVLLKFSTDSIKDYLSLNNKSNKGPAYQKLTLGECKISTGASFIAANDFFVGKRDHSSALYRLEFDKQSERQSSSGIIVSTPMGATGWQRSVVQGAVSILKSIGGFKKGVKFNPPLLDKPSLRFWVREPWPSLQSQANLVCGSIGASNPFVVVSEMGEGGVIFADGITQDAYSFPAGARATFSPSSVCGRLVLP
jgi:NAD kinase